MSFYLHEFLFLLLPSADGVSDGADLAEDGLRLLQLVAIRAVGHLLVDPVGGGGGDVVSLDDDSEQSSRRGSSPRPQVVAAHSGRIIRKLT